MRHKMKEGNPLTDTEAMKVWREEFSELTLEQHEQKLKSLGLDEEDIGEFNEQFGAGQDKKKPKEDK